MVTGQEGRLSTRVRCEQCGAVQPPDWQAGDLCIQGGHPVRVETRCAWCTRLTPGGQFCRHCGAGLVPDDRYGAARMLKAGGVDQFSLAARLEGLPRAQREHLSRLYAPQARMLERHLDDLAFAERFLRRGGSASGRRQAGRRAAALEAEWLPRLPLSEQDLKALTLLPAEAADELGRLAEIRDTTPFAPTAQVAALARIRLGADRNEADARWAGEALRSSDPLTRDEAALVLADWRFTFVHPYAAAPGDLRNALLDLYRRAPDGGAEQAEAGLGLALLAAQYANVQSVQVPAAVLEGLLASDDRQLAFGAALALNRSEALVAALRIPERRAAAARMLARHGQVGPLLPVLPLLDPHEQAGVLDTLRHTVGPVPELHDVLVELLARREVRGAAAGLLLLEARPGDAWPLIEADPSLARQVLSQPALTGAPLEAVCARLLDRDLFVARQLPFTELALSGRLPDSFVPRVFLDADRSGQEELLALAGLQLNARADAGLHAFLWQLIESGLPEQIRERAWGVLSGWYGQYGAELRCSPDSVRQFFGSVLAFMERLCNVVERPTLVGTFFSSYSFLRVLEDVDAAILPEFQRHPAAMNRLNRALLSLARTDDAYAPHRAAAVTLLGRLTPPDEGRGLLGEFLQGERVPWQVQRAALAVLYPTDRARADLRADLRTRLDAADTYEKRSPLTDLLYQLDQLPT